MPVNEALSSRIQAAQHAVSAQTGLMHRGFANVQSQWKSDGTRVTASDLAISENIVAGLRAQFPEDDFFSEELTLADGAVPAKARFAWVLDPIDGTNNYATGIPYCAISLGLLEQGRPVYGVVYDMARQKMIHGGPGFGLFDGDKAARVKDDAPNAQSIIGFHSPYDKRFSPHAAWLVENFKIRGLGSSTLHLAYVAIGILDGTVDHNVKIWDIAAAIPLCLAGGGQVHFVSGWEFPMTSFDLKMGRIFYVAGNAAVSAKLLELPKV